MALGLTEAQQRRYRFANAALTDEDEDSTQSRPKRDSGARAGRGGRGRRIIRIKTAKLIYYTCAFIDAIEMCVQE